MHLKEAELVDLAEGTLPESSVPHLAGCARCRRQLLEMRAMMAAAAAVRVPEPSPLFWDHLSNRVRQAVAGQATAPRQRWHALATWRRLLVPASAIAAVLLLIAGALTWRATVPQPQIASRAQSEAGPAVAPDSAAADPFDDPAEDDSLMLVADLSAAMNLDPATDANLAPSGSAEHAVMHLNDDQLRELERLLQQALAPSGA
jgi:hypothetical protein